MDTGEWINVDRALKRYFRRKLPEHDCDDLAGDVWLRTTHWYRGKGSLRTFVFIVARRLVHEFIYRRRQPRLAASSSGEDAAAAGPGPESLLALFSEHAALGRAVEQLPEPYREVVRLSLAGLDNFQIAAELGLAYNTVRSRLSRGNAQVREALRDEFTLP